MNRQVRSLQPHGGFTLIELMVVIVIIVLLIGLVLPAISSVRNRARDAEVRKEIGDLEQAITQFKVAYGVEPPSMVTLYRTEAQWTADTRSRSVIRRIWPRINLAYSDPPNNVGSGGLTFPMGVNAVHLNGAECLVFFLGGVANAGGALNGFSKDPQLPFRNDTSREGPFFDFRGAWDGTRWTGDRLMDYDNDLAPEYRDTLPGQQRPYVYFHSNDGGTSYPFSVLPAPSASPYTTLTTSSAGAYWIGVDCLGYRWNASNSRFEHSTQYDLMHHPYHQAFNPGTSTMTALAAARGSLPHKARSFQIISPGPDGVYGTGGLFNPENRANLSTADGDNITNFHPGRLAN